MLWRLFCGNLLELYTIEAVHMLIKVMVVFHDNACFHLCSTHGRTEQVAGQNSY